MKLYINEQIVEQLRLIEEVEEVRIIYACESGSRAWGFPSKDSDYDVRFLSYPPRRIGICLSSTGEMSSNGRSATCWILTDGI